MKLQRLAIVIVPLFILVSCSSQPTVTEPTEEAQAEPTEEVQAEPTEEPSSEPVELTLWGFTLPSHAEYMAELVAEYEAEHPEVDILVDDLAYTDLATKLSVSMGTGTGPDIAHINSAWLPPYVEQGLLEPISPEALGYASLDELKQAHVAGSLDDFIRNDELQVYPYYVGTLSLFLNDKDFENAGLDPAVDYPETWDEVLEVGKTLTDLDAGKQGFRFSIVSPFWIQIFFEPLLYQFGGSALDESGQECTLNSSAGLEAMSLIKTFVDEGIMDPEISVATPPLPTLDFAMEVAAMEPAHPLSLEFIRSNNEELWESGDFRVVPFPQVNPQEPVSLLYAGTFGINRAASPERKAVAQDFLRHAISRPGEWLERGAFISLQNALIETAEAEEFPYIGVFLGDIRNGALPTWSEHSAVVSSAEARAVEGVVYEGTDPQSALDAACEEIDTAIGGG